MEIIIFIVVGLFVLGAILAILKFIWGLFKKIWLIIIGIAVLFGISWLIKYGFSIIGLDIPIWIIFILTLFCLGYLSHTNEKKVHRAVAKYFTIKEMGDLTDITNFLDEKSIKYDQEILSQAIVKLVEDDQIIEQLPGRLWRSTQSGNFLEPIETVHIEI